MVKLLTSLRVLHSWCQHWLRKQETLHRYSPAWLWEERWKTFLHLFGNLKDKWYDKVVHYMYVQNKMKSSEVQTLGASFILQMHMELCTKTNARSVDRFSLLLNSCIHFEYSPWLTTWLLSNAFTACKAARTSKGDAVLTSTLAFFACFHAIPLECSRYNISIYALLALKPLLSLVVCLVARIAINKHIHTHRRTNRQKN